MPIGPLMIEHRLIERAIRQMKNELGRAEASKRFDVRFIDSWTDFMRTYADLVHHGKEERILFHDLAARPLAPPFKEMLAELIGEHAQARELLAALASARDRYGDGDAAAFVDIMTNGKALVELYPAHIRKEDQQFFVPVMEYLTPEEKDGMLKSFHEFDENIIHNHYRSVVESMEKRA